MAVVREAIFVVVVDKSKNALKFRKKASPCRCFWVRTKYRPNNHFTSQLQNIQSLFPGSSRWECSWQIQEGVVEHPAAGEGSVAQGQGRVGWNLPAGVGCRRQVEVSRRVEVLERAVQVSAWRHHGLGTSLWACDDLVDFLHSTFLLSVGRWYHERIKHREKWSKIKV